MAFSMSTSPSQPKVPVLSLLVTLNFTSLVYKEEFLSLIQPLAIHVEQYEPGTLQYQVLLSDRDELQVLLLERYRNKNDAYLKEHRSSKPFLEFRPKLQAMQEAGHVTVEGHSYLDSHVGFDGGKRELI